MLLKYSGMNKLVFFKKCLIVVCMLSILSCETDDIAPTLTSFTSTEAQFSEDGGSVTVTATLNASASTQLNITLTIGGTATQGVDYSLSASQIVINSGSSTGSITINAIQDDLIEGTETIELNIGVINGINILSQFNLSINLLDDDTDTDGDGIPDAQDECPDVAGPIENNGCPFLGFLINEVLYDPASGLEGDANGDGIRDPLEDEFIEFFNSGPELDISGYTISDASQIRHVFPQGTIVPMNGVIVVFGGGNPTGTFGGAIVQTATGGQLNMNNAGDFVTVQDASSNVIATFDITPLSGNPDEAYTRNPDIFGEFERHPTIPEANGALQSPGTKLDGSSF